MIMTGSNLARRATLKKTQQTGSPTHYSQTLSSSAVTERSFLSNPIQIIRIIQTIFGNENARDPQSGLNTNIRASRRMPANFNDEFDHFSLNPKKAQIPKRPDAFQ